MQSHFSLILWNTLYISIRLMWNSISLYNKIRTLTILYVIYDEILAQSSKRIVYSRSQCQWNLQCNTEWKTFHIICYRMRTIQYEKYTSNKYKWPSYSFYKKWSTKPNLWKQLWTENVFTLLIFIFFLLEITFLVNRCRILGGGRKASQRICFSFRHGLPFPLPDIDSLNALYKVTCRI